MTTGRLTIARAVKRALIAHADREHPRECCGFLLGRGRRVSYAVAATNVAQGNTRYRVDDREHLQLRKLLRSFVPAIEIVGVYHSHPAGSATASETDVAEAMYPDWVYVIVGPRSPRRVVRAFQFRANEAREIALQWTGAPAI
jgi:proteasome lid subunit RPN8/RPN11